MDKRYLNWVNIVFLSLVPIIAIVGTVTIIAKGQFHMTTLWLAIGLACLGGLSITAGYHRLFSHVCYKAAWPVRLVILLFGASVFEGSVLEWSTDHREHHRHTDTDKDPYNINRGFWFAHMGWLFTLDHDKRDYSNVADLMANPMIRLQHRFFVPIGFTMGFVLPMYIASLWGDMWGGLLIAGALRITFVQQMTFCINSVCHIFGSQTYTDRNSARDNWVTALFTFGEGYHNYHHQFALDYRNGVRFYHFDPAKWTIFSLYCLGLAKDLKRIDDSKILEYRENMARKKRMDVATDTTP